MKNYQEYKGITYSMVNRKAISMPGYFMMCNPQNKSCSLVIECASKQDAIKRLDQMKATSDVEFIKRHHNQIVIEPAVQGTRKRAGAYISKGGLIAISFPDLHTKHMVTEVLGLTANNFSIKSFEEKQVEVVYLDSFVTPELLIDEVIEQIYLYAASPQQLQVAQDPEDPLSPQQLQQLQHAKWERVKQMLAGFARILASPYEPLNLKWSLCNHLAGQSDNERPSAAFQPLSVKLQGLFSPREKALLSETARQYNAANPKVLERTVQEQADILPADNVLSEIYMFCRLLAAPKPFSPHKAMKFGAMDRRRGQSMGFGNAPQIPGMGNQFIEEKRIIAQAADFIECQLGLWASNQQHHSFEYKIRAANSFLKNPFYPDIQKMQVVSALMMNSLPFKEYTSLLWARHFGMFMQSDSAVIRNYPIMPDTEKLFEDVIQAEGINIISQEQPAPEKRRREPLPLVGQQLVEIPEGVNPIKPQIDVAYQGFFKPEINAARVGNMNKIIESAQKGVANYLSNPSLSLEGRRRATSFDYILRSSKASQQCKILAIHALLNDQTGGVFNSKGSELVKAVKVSLPDNYQTYVAKMATKAIKQLTGQNLVDIENAIIKNATAGNYKLSFELDDLDILSPGTKP